MNWVFRKAMKPMITTQKRVQGPSLRITVHHHCGPLLAPGNTQSNRRIPISSLQESTTAYVSRDLLSHLPQDSAELRNTEQERHQEGISRLSRTSCSAARWAKLMTPSFLSQVSQAHFLRCCF